MLLPNIERNFEFFDKFFTTQLERNSFPRATIFIDQEDRLVFNFALAGFTSEDVQATLDVDKLTIIGRKDNKPVDAKRVFQNQIAFRDFQVVYRIPAEYLSDEDIEAFFKDGILTVILKPTPPLKNTAKPIFISTVNFK